MVTVVEKMMKRKVRLKITTVSRQTISMPSSSLNAQGPLCEGKIETLSKVEAAGALAIADLALEELIAPVIETVSSDLKMRKD
ncbi:MAG: hypothetical protein ACREBC_31330 [Pyrinomonadaceae bacterium]